MVYYDVAKGLHFLETKGAYEALLDSLKKDDKESSKLALEYIEWLEKDKKEIIEKNNDFHNFFEMLQRMLPRQSSIHDRLG